MPPSESSGADETRPAWQRRAIRRFALALGLVVAGVLVTALTNGDGDLAGAVLMGLGFTLATIFVFLEVGLSEDRERASRER